MDTPFYPKGAAGTTPNAQGSVAVTTAVQQITLPGAPYANPVTGRFVVEGTANIAWSYGASSGLTTSNGVKMLANTIETFLIPAGVTQISAIGEATGSTLSITLGEGS